MQPSFSKRLLASLSLLSLAKADYYIDDQNFSSLIYSENPGGAKWGPFQEGGETLSISLANGTLMTVDASQCFNFTYTYAACTIADNCEVQIPFTGSGITVYVLQAGAQGINASLSIDGGTTKYNVLPPPPGPNFYIPNVTLFSAQGITTGNHTAIVTVQNWDNIFSGMMFDYALINQTIVSTAATGSAASSMSSTTASNPTSTSTSSPSNSVKSIGPIVGGVVGGVAALIAFSLALFFLCRRRRSAQRSSANIEAESKIEPFLMESRSRPGLPRSSTGITGSPTTESLATGTVGSLAPPHSTSSGSSRHGRSRLGVTNPSASQVTSAATQASSSTSSRSRASRPRIQQTHSMLTNDQADFVNSLYANNVPAAAIARVIERMIAGERRPVVDSVPPPSYSRNVGDE